jgi:hypothetical protein
MGRIREQLYETLAAGHPMTVRQVFYRMVSRPDALIQKSEAEYAGVAAAQRLDKARRARSRVLGAERGRPKEVERLP